MRIRSQIARDQKLISQKYQTMTEQKTNITLSVEWQLCRVTIEKSTFHDLPTTLITMMINCLGAIICIKKFCNQRSSNDQPIGWIGHTNFLFANNTSFKINVNVTTPWSQDSIQTSALANHVTRNSMQDHHQCWGQVQTTEFATPNVTFI